MMACVVPGSGRGRRFGSMAIAVLAAAALGAPVPGAAGRAEAVGTSTWSSEGTEELLQGETHDAVITAAGEIAPGPRVEAVLHTGESYLWALAPGEGGVVDAATGTHGRLFQVSASGAVDTLRASSEEDEIFALARTPEGDLVYGVSPSGLLLERTKGGAVDTLAHFEEHYIWSILPRPSGELIVATGQPGRVWRVKRGDARPALLFESDEEHVLSLAAAADGGILAGTGNRGLLYEIAGPQSVRILFDAPQKEIRAIVPLAGGDIAIAASGSGAPEITAVSDTADDQEGGSGDAPESGASAAGSGPGGGAAGKSAPPAVYRVRADGSVERIWRSPDEVIFTMTAQPDGALLVATGNHGRIYRLQPDSADVASLIARLDEPQVVSLLATPASTYAGTSNPATVYRISGRATDGRFTSRVFDAVQISRWGTLRYDLASGSRSGLAFESRSGNVADPGKGWSDWSAVRSAGTLAGGAITSPPGRYLQWRVNLNDAGADARIARVRVAFLPPNLPARITRLSVDAEGAASGVGPASAAPPALREVLPSGLEVQYSTHETPASPGGEPPPWTIDYRTVDWDVSNPDQDPLSYRLYYRDDEESTWHLLSDDIDGTAYTWNTASFPDGLYRLKLVASDSTANPPGTERLTERVSALFRVDHTAPVITELDLARNGKDLVLRAEAHDEGGVAAAACAVDGGDWRQIAPEDGIFDGDEERFTVTFAGAAASAGEHVVVIRVLDESGNQSVRRATLAP